MSQTLLQLVQSASAEMSLTVPTQVVGNTDIQVTQMYYLANALGTELMREYPWEAINAIHSFYTQYLTTTGDVADGTYTITGMASTTGLDSNWMVSGTGINQDTYVVTNDSATQVTVSQQSSSTAADTTLNFSQVKYNMPSDFDRQIDRTHYDKSKRWEMLGPETPQQWEFLHSSYISTGPRMRYRIMGGKFQIWPMVSTNEYLRFEYISNAWAASSGGTGQTSFSADADTCIYDDRLMTLGLKRKFLEAKGLNTEAVERDYQRQLAICKANDAGSATLSMAPKMSSVLIGFENIPDGSIYGQG